MLPFGFRRASISAAKDRRPTLEEFLREERDAERVIRAAGRRGCVEEGGAAEAAEGALSGDRARATTLGIGEMGGGDDEGVVRGDCPPADMSHGVRSRCLGVEGPGSA